MKSMPSLNAEKVIDIGSRYFVEWKHGRVEGDVVEKRLIKKYRNQSSDDINSEDFQPSDHEYYIHFLGYDRRLDEWISYDRIDTSKCSKGNAGHAESSSNSKHSNITAIRNDHKEDLQRLKKQKTGHREEKETNDRAGGIAGDKESILASLEKEEKEHEEITKVKNIQQIVLGKYQIDTWYFSPYPDEYCNGEKMYLCEFCLKYMRKEKTLGRHCKKCSMKAPPGKEVYREKEMSLHEVDGQEHKIYCQNLCLLSKLFLDHKTLYYDVDPFLFYILCEVDEAGSHIVGYFSKEKQSRENYNLACILTFPPYQRKGYGKLLISLSYELTRREGGTGSPEKPLSDLGKISYRSYWQHMILKTLKEDAPCNITINSIAKKTGIKTEDILSTLHSLNIVKLWKGKHVINFNLSIVNSLLAASKRIRLCEPSCLKWEPPKK